MVTRTAPRRRARRPAAPLPTAPLPTAPLPRLLARRLIARRLGPLLLALLLAPVAACSSGEDGAATQAPPPPALSEGPLKGPLLVFASTPLTAPLQEVQRQLTEQEPALQIRYTFAAPGVLAQQLEQKVPADVVAIADQEALRKLSTAKLIDTPAVFARDKLQIVVPKGNPKGIRTLRDLTRPGLRLALLDAGTQGGRDTRRLFDNQILEVTRASAPLEAEDAVAEVSSGKADATVLYVTDVSAAAGSVSGVAIPDRQNVVTSYRIAVLKAAKNPEAAKAYMDWLVNGPGQKLVKEKGFLTP